MVVSDAAHVFGIDACLFVTVKCDAAFVCLAPFVRSARRARFSLAKVGPVLRLCSDGDHEAIV